MARVDIKHIGFWEKIEANSAILNFFETFVSWSGKLYKFQHLKDLGEYERTAVKQEKRWKSTAKNIARVVAFTLTLLIPLIIKSLIRRSLKNRDIKIKKEKRFNWDFLPLEMTEEIFSYLNLQDIVNFGKTSKNNRDTVKAILNDPFFGRQMNEMKDYIWLKKENGDYQVYNKKDVHIKILDKTPCLPLPQPPTGEIVKCRRVQIGDEKMILSICKLRREHRTFKINDIKKSTKLPDDLFVIVKGHSATEKNSIFVYENFDCLLFDFIKNNHEKVFEDRFLIMKKMIGGLQHLDQQAFKNRFFSLYDFVVIKNDNQIDYKRLIPINLAFENGEGPITSTNCADNKGIDKRWYSPEILHNKFKADQRQSYIKSNVYAFGMFLWWLYTCGSIPFEGENVEGFYWQTRVINDGERPPLNRENFPKIKNEEEYSLLKELLTMTWHGNSEERPDYEELEQKVNDLENASPSTG